ncbi:MAG: hypothetical protein ACRDKW_06505 [Actinomycetota bacterium]
MAFVLGMVGVLGLGAWFLFLRPDGSAGPPEGAPTPSPPATPSPTPPADPQMGDDPVAAFRAIYEKRTRAFVERRPELVDEIYHPACACVDLKAQLQGNIEHGGIHVGFDPEVLLAKRKDSLNPNYVDVEAVTTQAKFKILSDQTNAVIAEDPGWEPRASHWTLVRDEPGKPWRVSFVLDEGSADNVLGPNWRAEIQ